VVAGEVSWTGVEGNRRLTSICCVKVFSPEAASVSGQPGWQERRTSQDGSGMTKQATSADATQAQLPCRKPRGQLNHSPGPRKVPPGRRPVPPGRTDPTGRESAQRHDVTLNCPPPHPGGEGAAGFASHQSTGPRQPEPVPSRHFSFPRISGGGAALARALAAQFAIVAGLLILYSTGRRLAEGHTALALRNARQLWSWERRWHVPNELALEHWFLAHPLVAQTADLYYASVHFPLTFAALLWLFLYRHELYQWTRDVLAVMTTAGLMLIFAFPMAPPRMMTGLGFTDVAAVFGQSVYHGSTISNQYASMPSLHVGWAVLVAAALVRAGRTRLRWLWLIHPLVTVLVVIGTANHYWADALVGAALLAIALPLVALSQAAWHGNPMLGLTRLRRRTTAPSART
jgi:hypothetical protein